MAYLIGTIGTKRDNYCFCPAPLGGTDGTTPFRGVPLVPPAKGEKYRFNFLMIKA